MKSATLTQRGIISMQKHLKVKCRAAFTLINNLSKRYDELILTCRTMHNQRCDYANAPCWEFWSHSLTRDVVPLQGFPNDHITKLTKVGQLTKSNKT